MPMLKINYRYRLKSKIHESGYRTVREFCREKQINEAQISRLINGRELPDEKVVRMLADSLNIDKHAVVALFA